MGASRLRPVELERLVEALNRGESHIDDVPSEKLSSRSSP